MSKGTVRVMHITNEGFVEQSTNCDEQKHYQLKPLVDERRYLWIGSILIRLQKRICQFFFVFSTPRKCEELAFT